MTTFRLTGITKRVKFIEYHVAYTFADGRIRYKECVIKYNCVNLALLMHVCWWAHHKSVHYVRAIGHTLNKFECHLNCYYHPA